MNERKLVLDLGECKLILFVNTPIGIEPIDDYREVNFDLPGKGRRRAVFFLLPDINSSNPCSTKPASEWAVPVHWDDPTMLYVPTLSDESILAAIKYVLESGLEDDAFENQDDIGVSDD